MKKPYETPDVELVEILDVIVTSNGDDEEFPGCVGNITAPG